MHIYLKSLNDRRWMEPQMQFHPAKNGLPMMLIKSQQLRNISLQKGLYIVSYMLNGKLFCWFFFFLKKNYISPIHQEVFNAAPYLALVYSVIYLHYARMKDYNLCCSCLVNMFYHSDLLSLCRAKMLWVKEKKKKKRTHMQLLVLSQTYRCF